MKKSEGVENFDGYSRTPIKKESFEKEGQQPINQQQ